MAETVSGISSRPTDLPFIMGGRSFVLLLLNTTEHGRAPAGMQAWGRNGVTAFARSLNKCGGDTQKTNTIFAGNLPRQLIRERDWLPFAKAEARRRASVGAARKL